MDLSYKPKSAWEGLNDSQMQELSDLSNDYLNFLNHGKTERECAKQIIAAAEAHGFKELDEVLEKGRVVPGTKVYLNNKGKSVVMMVIGKDMTMGMHIIGAHIDSPRLDVRQNPLYEEAGIAFLKTHYYGGVKKYQWTTIPLAIHGVIFSKTGKKIEVCIGEDEDDPVFFINDLLIHLSKKQLQETMAEAITGEQLNVVIGHMKPEAESKKSEKDKKKEEKKRKGVNKNEKIFINNFSFI